MEAVLGSISTKGLPGIPERPFTRFQASVWLSGALRWQSDNNAKKEPKKRKDSQPKIHLNIDRDPIYFRSC